MNMTRQKVYKCTNTQIANMRHQPALERKTTDIRTASLENEKKPTQKKDKRILRWNCECCTSRVCLSMTICVMHSFDLIRCLSAKETSSFFLSFAPNLKPKKHFFLLAFVSLRYFLPTYYISLLFVLRHIFYIG